MTNRAVILSVPALAALAAVLFCACEGAAEPDHPTFTGTWVIKGAKSAPSAATGGIQSSSGSSGIPGGSAGGGSTTTTVEPCPDVPETGVCKGDELRICVGKDIVQWPCGEGGGHCVIDPSTDKAMCVYPEGGDPCGPDNEGESVCNGDVVLWCEEGVLMAADCSTVSKVCDFDPEQGFDACVSP